MQCFRSPRPQVAQLDLLVQKVTECLDDFNTVSKVAPGGAHAMDVRILVARLFVVVLVELDSVLGRFPSSSCPTWSGRIARLNRRCVGATCLRGS